MSNFEIFLIVGLVLAPIVSLLFVLPKKIKKEKQNPPPPAEYKPEVKVEEKKEEPKEIKPQKVDNVVSSNEFKDYLTYKKEHLNSPVRIKENRDFPVEDYFPSRFRRMPKPGNKSVAEQIQDLSPELKAMLIAGVLDKKDFDEE